MLASVLGGGLLAGASLHAAAPTDILFSNHDIVEGSAAGTLVAVMSAADEDEGQSYLFELVSGTGGEHNHGFYILPGEPDKLYLTYELDRDFETETIIWNVRIRVTDSGYESYEKVTNFYMTDNRLEDSDGDGLTEEDEEDIHGTSDVDFDSDDDGVGDGAEVGAGTSPIDPNDWPESSFLGWGRQDNGELGAPVGNGYATLSTGQKHSLALKTDGSVAAWGGHDTFGQNSVPTGLGNVIEVSAGGDFWIDDSAHSVALLDDGTVTAWGYDHEGNLVLPGDLDHVISVAAGRSFALALRDDGTVRAWGYNPHGVVEPPAGLDQVVAIAAGGFHAIALRQNGSVVTWGGTFDGAEWVDSEAPVGLKDVVQVAAGRFHSLALKRDGTVVSWGFNSSGQTVVPAGLDDVIAVAAGGFHSLALKSDGSVVAWGENTDGQCNIPASAQGAVRRISAGLQHSLALRQDVGFPRISSDPHLVGTPGEEVSYQIVVEDAVPSAFWTSGLPAGLSLDPGTGAVSGTPLGPVRSSVRVEAETDQGVLTQIVWIAISEGEAPTAIQIAPGEVPEGGQQGDLVGILTATDADVTDSHSFELVSGSGDDDNFRFRIQGDRLEVDEGIDADFEQGVVSYLVRLRAIDSSLHSYEQEFVLSLGDVRTEDADGDGLTEADEEDVHLTSDAATDSDGDGFGDGYEVAMGTDPSLIADVPSGNLIVAWGENSEGQADMTPNTGADFREISAGYRHTLGLRTDGTVDAWGLNDHGQCDIPIGLAGVDQVSAGDLHSLALLSDGTVEAWGVADLGTEAVLAGPGGVPVGPGFVPDGLSGVVAVSAGAFHNLALLNDGTVVAWGEDTHGQCQVPAGLTDVVVVSAGGFHSLALKQDGTVVAWGSDWSGVSTVPAELEGVVGISAGGYHSLALLHDGSVVAWGANDQGQCDIPADLPDAAEVSAGWLFSVAMLGDGGVAAWGDNVAGQCEVPDEAVDARTLDAGDEFVVMVRQETGFPGFADPSPVVAWPGDAVARSLAVTNAAATAYEATGMPADLTFDPLNGDVAGTITTGDRKAVRVTATTDVGRLVAIVWFNTADGVAPTDIQLSPAEVAENAPPATVVGTLSTTDSNAGDSFTYELDFAVGISESYRFDIVGDELCTRYDVSADFETATGPLMIRVIATDSGGNSFAKELGVTLLDDRDEDADGDGFSEAFEEDVLGSSDLDGEDIATSDYDQDGIPGFIEHAFNLPPMTHGPYTYLIAGAGSTEGLPSVQQVPDGAGGKRLRLEYIQRTDPAYTYRPLFGDGTSWAVPSAAVEVTPIDAGWERCVVEDVDAGPNPTRRFGRVEVSY